MNDGLESDSYQDHADPRVFVLRWPMGWRLENEWAEPPPKELHGKTGYEKQNALGYPQRRTPPTSLEKAAKKAARRAASIARRRR